VVGDQLDVLLDRLGQDWKNLNHDLIFITVFTESCFLVPTGHEMVDLADDAQRLMPDPFATQGLCAIDHERRRPVTLFIGPEGGISDHEREQAIAHGFTPVRLGPRVLRTETAVIAALSAVMTLWGDLGS
jgi:hypothetical protein